MPPWSMQYIHVCIGLQVWSPARPVSIQVLNDYDTFVYMLDCEEAWTRFD